MLLLSTKGEYTEGKFVELLKNNEPKNDVSEAPVHNINTFDELINSYPYWSDYGVNWIKQ